MPLQHTSTDTGPAPHLRPNPGAEARAWAAAHARFLAAARRPGFPRPEIRGALFAGRYRFTLFDELGTRDAIAPVWTALHGFLRQAAPGGREPLAFIAAFRAPAGSRALFDALLWGQLQAMLELDRLQYPRSSPALSEGSALTASFGGRACVAVGLRSPDDMLVLDFRPTAAPQGAADPDTATARSRCV